MWIWHSKLDWLSWGIFKDTASFCLCSWAWYNSLFDLNSKEDIDAAIKRALLANARAAALLNVDALMSDCDEGYFDDIVEDSFNKTVNDAQMRSNVIPENHCEDAGCDGKTQNNMKFQEGFDVSILLWKCIKNRFWGLGGGGLIEIIKCI